MHPQTILDAIAELPRIQLARKNTPFEEMPRLRAAIAESMDAEIESVPQLFIKREDTTGFAFGGNKARHMEFLFAHFIERGIDTIVNINHYDSNNARFVAASCARTGMKYHWVAHDMVDAPVAGNMLIAHLAGANIHRVPDQPTARSLAEQINAEETRNGRNSTVLSHNPFYDIAGMIGFLEVGAELDTQITNFQPKIPSLSRERVRVRVNRAEGGLDSPPHRDRGPKRPKGSRQRTSPPSTSGASADAPSAAFVSTPATLASRGRLPPSPNSSNSPKPTKAFTSTAPPASPTSSD